MVKQTESGPVCLELIRVGKSFGGIRANDDISFTVQKGERFAIIGPNGAGKTTLFNIISGEFPPSEGQILLNGENVTKMKCYKRVRRGLSRTFQITELFWDLSVLENVILALLGCRQQKFSMFRSVGSNSGLFEEANELLDTFGLLALEGELIKNLSYGDQRLVELALALAVKPKILCLDEPNAGLSVSESQIMVNMIKKLSKDVTLLLIEHDMDMVFEVVDRIMVIHDGVLIAVDTTENIRKNEKVQKVYLGEGT